MALFTRGVAVNADDQREHCPVLLTVQAYGCRWNGQ
jgi:hypothetical protein